MRSWLALLPLLAVFEAGLACETVTFNIPKNGSCYSQAVFLNPASFSQNPNGTCIFHKVCSTKPSPQSNTVSFESTTESCIQMNKKTGTFSLIKKRIVTSVKERKIQWRCPTFERIPANTRVLLMRTHASNKVSPYWLFRNGNTSAGHMTIKEADSKRTVNFKSPLMATDAHVSLTKIYVEMFDRARRRATHVGFRINPGESIQKGRWFAKDRLISASPWSLSRMKSTKYNYFSIDGVKDVRTTRRFFINVSFGGCPNDRGFMAIVERAYCSWEKKNKKYTPSYIWTRSGSNYGRYNSRTYESAEFRLYGIFDTKSQYYARKSQNC